MPVEKFPDPRSADIDGIVAVGGDFHPETLRLAYSQGIFPWPIEEFDLIPWFCPETRGILDFKNFHIPHSLKKFLNKNPFTYTIDQEFEKIIDLCAHTRRDHNKYHSTWITDELRDGFIEFHKLGNAHSVETWQTINGKKELVGGLYGTTVNGVFAGESMYSKVENASKSALIYLINHLQAKGSTFIDIQVISPHMKLLGATEISRDEFLEKLKIEQSRNLQLF